MPENLTENQFNSLLQMKFRLKRLSHHQELSLLESSTLRHIEKSLTSCSKSREFLEKLGHGMGMMVG